MLLPIQINLRGIPQSPALESSIQKRAEKLERFFNRISSCRVTVESTQKHKRQGKLYTAHIDITVPGKELVVTHKKNEDVYLAIRDAFNAIAKQLENHARKQRRDVKKHADVHHGQIARMLPEDGYGFIDGDDGNEYYFNIANVSYPAFEQLTIGDTVEYISAIFGDGRKAHHVVLERHNHRQH